MQFRRLAVLSLLALTACASAPASQLPSESPTASEPDLATPSALPSPSPTATAALPTPTAPIFAPDTIVRVLLPGVALRVEAGLTWERLGTLPEGSRSFVVGPPKEKDGYTWIQLSGLGLPPASGCATNPGPELSCPTWFGWAAIGDPQTGEAWFVEDPTPDCPDPSRDPNAFMVLGDVEALHCYGNAEIELVGWLPGRSAIRTPPGCPVANDTGAEWLLCQENQAFTLRANDWEEVYVPVYVDPDSNVDLAYPGHWVSVVGHLDHPDAAGCAETTPAGWPVDPDWVTTDCRARLVVTSLTAAVR